MVGGTDNGRQKTRNHGYDVIVGGELFTDYSDHPRKLVTKPKTQINRRRTLPASFPLVGCLPQAAWPERLLSEKSGRCCSRWGVALYLWLIVVISVRQSTVAAISGLHCRALVHGQFEHKADSLIAKFKEAGGTVREIDVWAESPRLSPLWLSASSSALSWAVNHYRDNAITYKAQRDKNARELKLANAAITYADASAWCCCARCKIHEELADAKAENDALRDDVAAGRRRLHIKAVCQSVREATTASGVDNAASPTGRHPRWTGLFHPQRGWSLCKNNWKNPEVLMSNCR